MTFHALVNYFKPKFSSPAHRQILTKSSSLTGSYHFGTLTLPISLLAGVKIYLSLFLNKIKPSFPNAQGCFSHTTPGLAGCPTQQFGHGPAEAASAGKAFPRFSITPKQEFP